MPELRLQGGIVFPPTCVILPNWRSVNQGEERCLRGRNSPSGWSKTAMDVDAFQGKRLLPAIPQGVDARLDTPKIYVCVYCRPQDRL
jgi:hypothetical protein